MTELVVDSGIRTRHDLLGILPPDVAARVDVDELADANFAAALRLLATVKNPRWHAEIFSWGIRFVELAELARDSGSVGLRVAAAASLYGVNGCQFDLRRCVRALGHENFLAFIDALRIAREGLEP